LPRNATIADRGFDSVQATTPPRALRNARLKEAAAAMRENRPEAAQRVLSGFLKKYPRNIDALYLMAEADVRLGRFEYAEVRLAICVEQAPDFDAARFAYARALHQLGKSGLAASQLETLLEKEPRNTFYRDLHGLVLTAMGKHAEALAFYRALAADYPKSGELGMRYGHALRTMGLRGECIAAYRSVIKCWPERGDAYWSLAGLKVRFTGAELDSIQALLKRSDLTSENRVYLHFALGRAFGDLALWEKSFENYAKANAIRRLGIAYDPDSTTRRAEALMRLFTPAFFDERAGAGCNSPEPIFVLGMQRSGSTLVEQILASHSAIEGAGELPDIPLLAARFESHTTLEPEYRVGLDTLDAAALRSLGAHYLASTRWRRNHGRRLFIDKQPFNFWHVGLIHITLPNAKIVDVRRNPAACCFSNFSTLLGHGQDFCYRLSDLGRYYRDYVELMAHFDRVLSGKIYRVCYERLIAEPETEIRRLLEYLGLPFEAGCLRFYANNRAFDSASNEQVRTPIFRDGVERWRNYDAWLGPLRDALGPVLQSFPAVPQSGAPQD
jgi:tetratricopeptide (TPR) repeat protein